MTHYNPNAAEFAEMYGLGPDSANMNLPAAREIEEDWTDLRWELEQVATDLEGQRILQAYIIAENAAYEYLELHPPPTRPEPEWLDWDDDLGDEKL